MSPFRTVSLIALAAASLSMAACKPSVSGSSALNIPEVTPAQIDMAAYQADVKELSSDEFGGRAPSTKGEELTTAFLVKQFEAAGLKPGGVKGSWFQDVPLVQIESKNVSPMTFTGAQGDTALKYKDDFVIGSYRVTPKTEIKDSDVVFVGYGINAPEKGWNDYAGKDVKGKTVLILVNDPDYQTNGLDGEFGGRAMTYYGRWTYKYEEAARQGAAAAIIIHDTEPAAYGFNVVQSSWTGPQYMADATDNHMGETQANGWISNEKAKALLTNAGQDLTALSEAAKKKGFKPVDLPLKMSVSFDNEIKKTMSKNVIGILPGTKRPDEYVLYTGHWDHLGECGAGTPPANRPDDIICNGAVDNATGTAALIALAKANNAAGAADRSQVFLAVTAEESGLLGSKYYAENPVYPLAKTVAGVNMDALSIAGPAKNIIVVGKGKSQLDQYLEAAVKEQSRSISAEPTPEKGFYYRSDHFSFAKLGVPMIYFEGGDDLVNGGKVAAEEQAKAFEADHYHAPSDEYALITNWDGIAQDLGLYYIVGRMLAMSDSWPNWNDGDEFRAVRDKSREGAAPAK